MVAPKPPDQRRRRNATPGFLQIDPTPRTDPTPDWPLEPNAIDVIRDREMRRWEELWQLPQAREWERMQCYVTVALYARLEVLVALDMTNPKLLMELRQLDATIGISPRSILGLHWEIPVDPKAEPTADEMRGKLHAVSQRAYVPAG